MVPDPRRSLSLAGTSHLAEAATGTFATISCIAFVWHVAAQLNIGVDVSDTAYYIISYAMTRDVESQTTLAGWLWSSLSPFDGILANRFLALALTVFSFAALAAAVRRKLAARERGLAAFVVVPSFAILGGLTYYGAWLVDPSYNLMNLQFIALSWSAFLLLSESAPGRGPKVGMSESLWTLVVSALVASLVLIKATAAAALGLLFFGAYLAMIWKASNPWRLVQMVPLSLIGALLPFLVVAANGEGFHRIFSTMAEGYAAARLVAPLSLDPFGSLIAYVKAVAELPQLRAWYIAVAAIAIAVAMSDRFAQLLRLSSSMRLLLSTVTTASFCARNWSDSGALPLSAVVNATMVLVFALAAGVIIFSPRAVRTRAFLIWCAMFVSPFIYSFGTGNRWYDTVVGAAGFAWVAMGAAILATPKQKRPVAAIPGFGLLVLAAAASSRAMEVAPYRLEAPLSALATPATVGPRNEIFLESPKQAEFYNTLATVRPLVERLAKKPYLIDLTGRTPMVAYQIGARAPRTPWLLSGYPGSLRMLDYIISKMPQEDLSHAWIFKTETYEERHPDSALTKYGLKFPEAYEAVVTVPVAYMGFVGTLYAPAVDLKRNSPN